MRCVRGKGTKPELAVRALVHRLGYRYRLHDRQLPGKPDLVFPSRRKVILVHGCFWHQHSAACKNITPKSNTEFWSAKLRRNVVRDAENLKALLREGWKVLTVWECQVEKRNLTERVRRFLDA
jgi:DNA mismatch endonuclease (patch repair protein)